MRTPGKPDDKVEHTEHAPLTDHHAATPTAPNEPSAGKPGALSSTTPDAQGSIPAHATAPVESAPPAAPQPPVDPQTDTSKEITHTEAEPHDPVPEDVNEELVLANGDRVRAVRQIWHAGERLIEIEGHSGWVNATGAVPAPPLDEEGKPKDEH